jgi:hypothetical protein
LSSRLTSSLHVASIIRRVNGVGGFAAVLRHGSDEAGAIFICVPGERGEGTALYGQAPQSVIADREIPASGGRLFELLASGLTSEEISTRFDREARMDPDFWAIELELFGRRLEEFVDIA